MVPGSTIGAATVVDQTSQALPDKYQSYMRAMMRSTAIARGRDPKIAEAMVDPDIYIPGIIDSGKVLTFTAQEALKNGFCDEIVQDFDDLIAKNNLQNAQIIKMRITWLDKLINFSKSPCEWYINYAHYSRYIFRIAITRYRISSYTSDNFCCFIFCTILYRRFSS